MVRVLIIISLLFSFASAASLQGELKNILGKNSYQAKKKFLKILFKDERSFYLSSQINIHKVLNTLNQNNLLQLNYKSTKDLHISFATEQNSPLIFMKMLQNSLNTLGYSAISTEKVMKDSSGFLWKIKLKTSKAIDPFQLANELDKQNCNITKLKRYSGTNWRYNINIKNIDIVPKKTPFNQKITLKKPLNPYWIDIQRAKSLIVKSSKANSWHPYIVFYDKDLKILNNISKEIKSYNESLNIPRDAKYVKISDVYTLENLKRGLSIYISK